MHSMSWDKHLSAWNQEQRDRTISREWGVSTPYALFCRHHYMDGMPGPVGERCNEMVVYTQIQRSLFYLKPLSDNKVMKNASANPFPFHLQKRRWNIKVPRIALEEMRRRFELDIAQALVG